MKREMERGSPTLCAEQANKTATVHGSLAAAREGRSRQIKAVSVSAVFPRSKLVDMVIIFLFSFKVTSIY